MVQLTIELTEDDFWRLRYRAEACGLPCVDALIAKWIATDDTDETRIETLRSLLKAGYDSGISDRSLQDIMQDHRARIAAA